ncbi:MAG: PaaI family thioesterase [Alphaproteobacteria bacterium]|nr:PaaI family thioesterase [Alphaproteobacteria bacterium]
MTSSPIDLSAYTPMSAMAGFNAYVGTMLRHPGKAAGEAARFAFVPGPQHLNGGGALHGGFLMTLADNVLGITANEAAGDRFASTVTLNTDFLAGGTADGPVLGTAEVTRKTRSLIFVAGELVQGGRLLMTASGIWKIIGA